MMREDMKVEGSLVGVDGNAFSLLAHFKSLAKAQGFDGDWIDKILRDAMSDDYDHLIYTLSSNMTN